MSKALHLVAVVISLTFAPPALAHDTWIAPRAFFTEAGGTVRFDATSHDAFPALDFAIAPDRIARSGLRLGGQTRPLVVRRRAAKSLELEATLPISGIAVAWIELAPRSLELTPDKVAEYLKDIAWAGAVPAAGRWRESYRKLMKTIVAVGEASSDRSAAEPVGLALELVPIAPASALHVGDSLRLRLLKDGRPLGGLPVAAHLGATPRRFATTNAEGEARFALDGPGPWLFAATELVRSTKPGLEWESLFTTLTLNVDAAKGSSPP